MHNQFIYSGFGAMRSTSSKLLVEGFHFWRGQCNDEYRKYGESKKCQRGFLGRHEQDRKNEKNPYQCRIPALDLGQIVSDHIALPRL